MKRQDGKKNWPGEAAERPTATLWELQELYVTTISGVLHTSELWGGMARREPFHTKYNIPALLDSAKTYMKVKIQQVGLAQQNNTALEHPQGSMLVAGASCFGGLFSLQQEPGPEVKMEGITSSSSPKRRLKFWNDPAGAQTWIQLENLWGDLKSRCAREMPSISDRFGALLRFFWGGRALYTALKVPFSALVSKYCQVKVGHADRDLPQKWKRCFDKVFKGVRVMQRGISVLQLNSSHYRSH